MKEYPNEVKIIGLKKCFQSDKRCTLTKAITPLFYLKNPPKKMPGNKKKNDDVGKQFGKMNIISNAIAKQQLNYVVKIINTHVDEITRK